MRFCITPVTILLLIMLNITIHAQQNDFPVLTGPYLGQTPPVDKPLVFAPGIVSTKYGNHSSPAFTPDGNEIYWSMNNKIWFTRMENNIWTEPEIVSFCTDESYLYDNPFITTDGKKMFFTTYRSGPNPLDKDNIWYVERTGKGWSDPKLVGPEVNNCHLHWSISVSDSGSLYFGFKDRGTNEVDEARGIYCSKLVNGKYQKPFSISPIINTPATETCPYIAPDESYILFTRFDQTNFRNTGIFISYRDKDGKWLPPLLIAGGDKKSGGFSARISPDGKYLFYINGDAGTFWMPATFIEELRPK